MAKSNPMQGFRKRGDIWHIITDPITGKARSTKCRDEEGALNYRRERERLANAPPEPPSTKATIGEWIGRYWKAQHGLGIAERTLAYREGKLGTLRRVLGDDRRLETITPGFVDSYVEHRRSEGVSDRTTIREIRELIAVLRLAKRADCYAGDLQALMPTLLDSRYRPRQRALSADEVAALLQAMPTNAFRALVAICVALGCRLSEAFRLRPEDIEHQVVIGKHRKKREQTLVWIDGRKTTGANRVVPVLTPFIPLLKLAQSELPLGEMTNLNRTFKLACKRAGIERCSPNDLRRTHATLVGEKGVTNEQIGALLGHRGPSMSQRVYNRAKAIRLAPVLEGILSQSSPIEFPDKLQELATQVPSTPSSIADRGVLLT
ncbi:MAG: site-specific integrase [Polyangiaceae bacterium]